MPFFQSFKVVAVKGFKGVLKQVKIEAVTGIQQCAFPLLFTRSNYTKHLNL